MSAPNGASTFVKKMNSLVPEFEKEGVLLRVISLDLVSPRSFDNVEEIRKHTNFRQRVVGLAKYSLLLTRLVLQKTSDKYAKAILDYYDTIFDKGDVVAFQEISTCYYYLKQKHHIKKQKVLLTLHNNGEFWSMLFMSLPRMKSWVFNHYRKDLEDTLLKGCYKIGFVADLPRKHFCSLYPFDVNKTYYVYNGIEQSPISQHRMEDKINLVCVGTLCERKNQMGILNALSQLPNNYLNQITLTLVGDGPARTDLELKASLLNTEINFVGNSNDVDKYLKLANCFILFSKDEGLPISILEGMRSGLPIISTNIAGIPEQVIDGKTGYLVDIDEGQLASVFIKLVDNRNQLIKMGEDSYNYYLSKFTIERMVKRYAEVYKS